MNFNDLIFYEDDEGMTADVMLDSFKNQEIQMIYLESSAVDENLRREVDFFLSNQDDFFRLANKEILSYCKRVYNLESPSFELLKLYFFPDLENEFGFLFKLQCDVEHGVGVRFSGLSIKKVGGGEVSFM